MKKLLLLFAFANCIFLYAQKPLVRAGALSPCYQEYVTHKMWCGERLLMDRHDSVFVGDTVIYEIAFHQEFPNFRVRYGIYTQAGLGAPQDFVKNAVTSFSPKVSIPIILNDLAYQKAGGSKGDKVRIYIEILEFEYKEEDGNISVMENPNQFPLPCCKTLQFFVQKKSEEKAGDKTDIQVDNQAFTMPPY